MDNIIVGIIILVAIAAVYFVWKKAKYKPLGDKLTSLFRKKPDGDQ